MTQPPLVSAQELIERYDAFFIDAYGVLVNARHALPGALGFLEKLKGAGKPFFVVTNDASRSQETCSKKFERLGLSVPPEDIITSGSLLSPYFQAHKLQGKKTMVFGPDDSKCYVQEAGGVVVPIHMDQSAEVVVAADDAGYPFLESLETALSVLYRLIDAGGTPHLVLPNPDLIYPKGDGEFGFTSGAVSLLLEAGLKRRYPESDYTFTPLGKPHPAIYQEALSRSDGKRALMIGDQLQTDILGARRVGLDAALLLTGVCPEIPAGSPLGPTWVLQSLES